MFLATDGAWSGWAQAMTLMVFMICLTVIICCALVAITKTNVDVEFGGMDIERRPAREVRDPAKR